MNLNETDLYRSRSDGAEKVAENLVENGVERLPRGPLVNEASLHDELSTASSEDPRLLQAACEYLADLEAGKVPSREGFKTRYSGLGEALDECLDAIELAHSIGKKTKPTQSLLTAEPLGDFRIICEIGRGGMGIVYKATQLSLGRSVALKVLPFAASLDHRHLQRFQFEAQAAAQLHHSNIVPVYAVGCDRGTHYYAMQLIDGKPISEALADLRNADKAPDRASTRVSTNDQVKSVNRDRTTMVQRQGDAMTEREGRNRWPQPGRDQFRNIAAIIADVADALEYAHSEGIIHRDIKPANLLLDSMGKVWITDFGLAQIAANHRVTMTGDMLGTLRYMSPEQASGAGNLIDHRTDIYALGATMYELLTLQPVFLGDDRNSLLNQILHDDPRPPRLIDRSIPFELETIVMKSLAANAVDRYSSAQAFADDLKRFLAQHPILAKRPTLVDRMRKWGRRHPSVIGSAIIILILSVMGLGISTAAVTREKSRTVDALSREQARAAEAQLRLRLAQRAADEMIWLAENELSDNPFEEGLRQRMLHSALVYYHEFIRANETDPQAQAELEQTRDRVQSILADLAVLQSDRNIMLLNEPAVLNDLGVNSEQMDAIQEVVRRHREDRVWWFQDRGGRGPQEHYVAALESAKQNDTLLTEALTPAQRERLRQIALRLQGPRAFQDYAVIEALGLTQEQRTEMKTIFHSVRGSRDNGGRNGGPPPRGGGWEADFGPPPPPRDPPPMREFGKGQDERRMRNPSLLTGPPEPRAQQESSRDPTLGFTGRHSGHPLSSPSGPPHEQLVAEIVTILTESQRTKWQELIGDPFFHHASR